MKDKGNSMWWVIVIILLIILTVYISFWFGGKRATKLMNSKIEQEKIIIQQEWKVKNIELEKEKELYKKKYDDLLIALKRKVKEKESIKTPKDEQEIKERFNKLGYPAK